VASPICRTEFPIPAKGVDGLPKNVFIEPLKDIDLPVISTPRNRCDGCGEDDESKSKQAVEFCFKCQQKFCVDCASSHTRLSKGKGILACRCMLSRQFWMDENLSA
jgi:hypothetical protein